MSCAGDEAYEDQSLRDRLAMREYVYIARADSRRAARRLQKLGEIAIRDGCGRDQGLLIASRVTR